MYYTSDLPVNSKTPLPHTSMYPDLKPHMLHSMRSWADTNEEKVLHTLSSQVQFNIRVDTPI